MWGCFHFPSHRSINYDSRFFPRNHRLSLSPWFTLFYPSSYFFVILFYRRWVNTLAVLYLIQINAEHGPNRMNNKSRHTHTNTHDDVFPFYLINALILSRHWKEIHLANGWKKSETNHDIPLLPSFLLHDIVIPSCQPWRKTFKRVKKHKFENMSWIRKQGKARIIRW